MYRIYYLTLEIDNNQPMYIGMTKLSLEKRLKAHKTDVKHHNKKCNWIRDRNKKITIHIIEDNIHTHEECILKELKYIKELDLTNLNNKNSRKFIVKERMYKKSLKEIGQSISIAIRKGAVKCKPIVALDKNGKFLEEFPTIIAAKIKLKLKDGTIINSLKERSKSRKFLFVYKDQYDANIDYTYKSYYPGVYVRKIKPVISGECYERLCKKSKILDLSINKIFEFNTQQKACDFMKINSSFYGRCKKGNKLIKGKFKIIDNDKNGLAKN